MTLRIYTHNRIFYWHHHMYLKAHTSLPYVSQENRAISISTNYTDLDLKCTPWENMVWTTSGHARHIPSYRAFPNTVHHFMRQAKQGWSLQTSSSSHTHINPDLSPVIQTHIFEYSKHTHCHNSLATSLLSPPTPQTHTHCAIADHRGPHHLPLLCVVVQILLHLGMPIVSTTTRWRCFHLELGRQSRLQVS